MGGQIRKTTEHLALLKKGSFSSSSCDQNLICNQRRFTGSSAGRGRKAKRELELTVSGRATARVHRMTARYEGDHRQRARKVLGFHHAIKDSIPRHDLDPALKPRTNSSGRICIERCAVAAEQSCSLHRRTQSTLLIMVVLTGGWLLLLDARTLRRESQRHA